MQGVLKTVVLLFAVAITGKAYSQDISLGGYVSGLYMPMIDFGSGSATHNGLLHNRLNFKYTPSGRWSFAAEIRNRALFPNPASTTDNGFMNLSFDWIRNPDFVFNTSIERFNIAYKTDRLSVVAGRQRINWSQTLSFNPNDIFNSYSLFDFDYTERSGSDAVRVSYYPSGTSVIEIAAKLNRWGKATTAFLHRFNTKGVDIQYLAGVVNGHQLVVGGGFSGEIKGVNIRGEVSDFYDTKAKQNTVLAALGADYVFPNSISLSAEVFYNQQHGHPGSIMELYTVPMTPSRLSITPWTVSAQFSYPFTPIFSGGFAAMSFIDIPMFYFGPSADVSLSDNFTLSVMAQVFAAGNKMQPSNMGVAYVRLKYNF